MTKDQEDALIQEAIYAMDCPVSGDRRAAIRLAIRAAVAHERERCAKVCCERGMGGGTKDRPSALCCEAWDCAAAIRRGE